MNPLRLSVSFPADRLDDLEPAIALFHRMIQYGWLEGLVLDVADYRHVPQGPGVVLVGHDVDYGLTARAFTVVRKRSMHQDAGEQFRDALRMGLGAIEAVQRDGTLGATFDIASPTIAVFDRGLGDQASSEADLRADAEPVVAELFGPDAKVEAITSDDARSAPQLRVTADPATAAGVLPALGGSRAPGQSPWDISVEELARLRASDEDFVLLDVREESEYETVNLGGKLIPLATVSERLGELDKSAKVVVHCRAGRRGATAVQQLRDAGFSDAWNVNGALMAWIDRIDPALPRY